MLLFRAQICSLARFFHHTVFLGDSAVFKNRKTRKFVSMYSVVRVLDRSSHTHHATTVTRFACGLASRISILCVFSQFIAPAHPPPIDFLRLSRTTFLANNTTFKHGILTKNDVLYAEHRLLLCRFIFDQAPLPRFCQVVIGTLIVSCRLVLYHVSICSQRNC